MIEICEKEVEAIVVGVAIAGTVGRCISWSSFGDSVD